jgi:hypothetical protein
MTDLKEIDRLCQEAFDNAKKQAIACVNAARFGKADSDLRSIIACIEDIKLPPL